MKKLFKLKEWLTLEETARRLTTSFQEDVSIPDCLQLALDGHIIVSALIEKSRYGILASKERVGSELLDGFVEFLLEKKPECVTPEMIIKAKEKTQSREVIVRRGNIFHIDSGVYDLSMIGAEALDVLHLCSIGQGREPAEFINLEGPLLNYNDGYINVMEPFNDKSIVFKFNSIDERGLYDESRKTFITEENYHASFYPADGLRDVEFVFRRENIEKFETSQLEDNSSMSLDESLLVIGCIIDSIKNASTKSKRWTQEGLKLEITERHPKIKPRLLDDYFSMANKSIKSNN
ncbi:hypothetical protein [Serratia quinivorans]|uniref:hypothetical protein n=1 Tax=Serratia quinivorans TaxID=137545 RepID=UPI002E784F98|nr:hypothetical protein [Serratia quinivorans]